MVVAPYLLLIILAFGISILLRLSPIESLFIGIASVIIFMLILTYTTTLTIAVYVVSISITVLFISSIFISVKRKSFARALRDFYTDPIFLLFILIVGAYTVLTYDRRLYFWDDFSHWGSSVKLMLAYNGLNIAKAVHVPQSLGLPILNAFFAFIAEYREGTTLSVMWVVYGASLLLPVARHGWRQWRTIAVYILIMGSILMSVAHETLYNDVMLGIVPASLLAYYFVNRDKKDNFFLVVVSGLLLVSQIKKAGFLFALFVLALIVCEIFNASKKRSKVNYTHLMIYSGSVLTGMIIDSVSRWRTAYIVKAVSDTAVNKLAVSKLAVRWSDPIGSIKASTFTMVGILLLVLALLSLSIYIWKRKSANWLKYMSISIFWISVLLFSGYTYINLDAGTTLLAKNFVNRILSSHIFSFQFYKAVFGSFIVSIVFILTLIKREFANQFRRYSITVIIQAVVYCMAVLYAYTGFGYDKAVNFSSMDRYMHSFYIYLVITVIAILIVRKDIWRKPVLRRLFIFALIFLLSKSIMPGPDVLSNLRSNVGFERSSAKIAEMQSVTILKTAKKEERVYIVAPTKRNFTNFVLQYYCPEILFNKNSEFAQDVPHPKSWTFELCACVLKSVLNRT